MEQFDILQTLGKGSFGVVRKVRRRVDGKTLVVKEMDYGAADEKQKEQIVAEVNILRELRHPFIVRYYDRIVDRRKMRLHIVMEHCSTDLARVIRARRLRGEYMDEVFLWNLLCQVVVALEFCHGRVGKGGARRPIIHRDLKPENVFLTDDNVVKLGDFGLAKELSGGQLAETSVGTPYYMSPELINEQRYDERTDVWSLGCLMYEAAALSRPFNANNQLALAMKINAGRVAPIPSRYSSALFATIESMLNKVRHKRPRMEDLIKVPGLQLPLRENRLLVREFQLHQSYVHRLRDLKARETEISRREAELASSEMALRRRTETLTLFRQEHSCALPSTTWLASPATATTAAVTPNATADAEANAAASEREQRQRRARLARGGSRPNLDGNNRMEEEEEEVAVVANGGGGRRRARRQVVAAVRYGGEEEEEQDERGVLGTPKLARAERGDRGEGSGGGRRRGEGVPEGFGGLVSPGGYDTPRSRDESQLRQNVTNATTAVLGYASLVLHRSPGSVEDGSGRCVDNDHHLGGGGGVNDQQHRPNDANNHRSNNKDERQQGNGSHGCKDLDSDSSDHHHRLSDHFGGYHSRSPNGCLDDTVPLDSNHAMPMLVPRHHKRNGFLPVHGGVVDVGGARGWKEGELHSRKAEAVTAAGRRARETYTGFMETIAAAGDLGTWAPAGGGRKNNKENLHPRGMMVRPRFAAHPPLSELHDGGRFKQAACHLVAKERRVTSTTRRGGYQRSASDVPKSTQASVVAVAVQRVARRGGYGDDTTTTTTATAAAAIAQARRGRISRY